MIEFLIVMTVLAIVIAPLTLWVLLIMWLSARSDRKYREREALEQVFGKTNR